MWYIIGKYAYHNPWEGKLFLRSFLENSFHFISSCECALLECHIATQFNLKTPALVNWCFHWCGLALHYLIIKHLLYTVSCSEGHFANTGAASSGASGAAFSYYIYTYICLLYIIYIIHIIHIVDVEGCRTYKVAVIFAFCCTGCFKILCFYTFWHLYPHRLSAT